MIPRTFRESAHEIAAALVTVCTRAEDLLRRGEITPDAFHYLFDGKPPQEPTVSLNLVVRQPNGLLGYFDPAAAVFVCLNLTEHGMRRHLMDLGFTEAETGRCIGEAEPTTDGGTCAHPLDRWIAAVEGIAKLKPESLRGVLLATVAPHRDDPVPPIVELRPGVGVWIEVNSGGSPVLTSGTILEWNARADAGVVETPLGRYTGVERRNLKGVLLSPVADPVGPEAVRPAAAPIPAEELRNRLLETNPEYIAALERASSRPPLPAPGSRPPRRRRSFRRPNGVR